MKSVRCFFIVISIVVIFPAISNSAVIFEDDFSNDSGWSGSGSTVSWTKSSAPSKWTAYKNPSGTTSEIIANAGIGSVKPAWRLGYAIGSTSNAIALGKHLTGISNVGYNEIYVRYQFKFSNDWKSGTDGTDMDYWKWIRLWQGIDPNDSSTWSENNNPNTRYIVTNLNAGSTSAGCNNSVWADNAPGPSQSGPRYKVSYYDLTPSPTDGCLGSMTGLRIQRPGDPYPGYFETYPSGSQSWHTIEYRFKLSTTQAGNGIQEIWLDGKKQHTWDAGVAQDGGTMSYLNTMSYNGGINFITAFDNMASWSKDWGTTKRYIYVDNIVVSTSYIGPDYVIGGGSPPPPADTMPPAPPQQLR